MVALRHIISGTDFSETSKGALSEALRLTVQRPEGHLTVVHVTARTGDEAHRQLRAEVEAFVLGLPAAAGLDPARLTCSVVAGGIAEGIAAVAEAAAADLIVVGPLRKGFVERYVLGGTAEQLVSRTHVPVLSTTGPRVGGYEHVLVPVDFSELSARVLTFAGAFVEDAHGAVSPDAHIDLLHAFTAPGGVHAHSALKELSRELEVELTARLKEFAARCGVAHRVRSWRAVHGVSQDVIPREAHVCGADIVFMGSGGKGALSRRILGSTTSAVMNETTLPMLVVWP